MASDNVSELTDSSLEKLLEWGWVEQFGSHYRVGDGRFREWALQGCSERILKSRHGRLATV